jgi:hypothetical protein
LEWCLSTVGGWGGKLECVRESEWKLYLRVSGVINREVELKLAVLAAVVVVVVWLGSCAHADSVLRKSVYGSGLEFWKVGSSSSPAGRRRWWWQLPMAAVLLSAVPLGRLTCAVHSSLTSIDLIYQLICCGD